MLDIRFWIGIVSLWRVLCEYSLLVHITILHAGVLNAEGSISTIETGVSFLPCLRIRWRHIRFCYMPTS